MLKLTAANYADLAGRFSVIAVNGDQYMLVMYSVDANYIHVETMPDKSATSYVAAFKRGHLFFAEHGFKVEFETLDNEVSGDLLNHFRKETINYQLVPPNSHRRNKAERAIQTWKNNKISVLATADDMCPGGAFKNVNAHCEMILNLVR